MIYLAAIAMAPALAATPAPDAPAGLNTTELSVLTYNVRGLPWPLALGRAEALRGIGAELAAMRREGRQPDVVLIQEGFRGEVGDLVRASGYRYWAQGPTRADRAPDPPPPDGRRFRAVRYLFSGEGWGKFTGAGLHLLSDAPIAQVRTAGYRYCAGLDCLANKGVMLARLDLPDVPGGVDVVNTHLNARRAARVPLARSLAAHNLQTEELIGFISAHRTPGAPLLVGGDFNVRNAPDRYGHRAESRPYKVVSEFCHDPANACDGAAPPGETPPWLRSQDLQAFAPSAPVDVRPIRVETLFAGGQAASLSDHDGYLVRYRLSWTPPTTHAARAPIQVRPRLGVWGLKVSVKY
ncbi:endonuclease/exonuclease/phosphatase family protein [Phenylobacterium sp.]|uniref:endonuclease/exonuclease/phosphatase family protein n=1 Tax=Phenylobacterium sp. TaxID=1871053 RepID=UPI003983B550